MAKKVTVKWLGNPKEHDYPAALSYLSLIFDVKTAAGIVRRAKLVGDEVTSLISKQFAGVQSETPHVVSYD